MSGGYFDYNQYKLQNIEDDLWKLLDEPESEEVLQLKEDIIKEFDSLVEIGEDTVWKRISDVKKEIEL